jgi:hypothetical protein
MVNEIVTPAIGLKNFKGWNSVTEYHSTIQAGASSEIKARNEVNLHNEFHAELGSETHIYCEAVFTDCNIETNNFQKIINKTNYTSTDATDFKRGSVELSFSHKTNFTFMDIKPIPSNGNFTIEISSNEFNDIENEIRIFDIHGKIITSIRAKSKTIIIDLTNHPFGVYNVQLISASKVLNQKIILQ